MIRVVLPEIPLFAGLPEEERHAVEAAGRDKTVQQGDLLVGEGESAEDLLILVRGQASVIKRASGVEHVISELDTNEPIGEISFFDGQARSATVRATTEVVVFAVPFTTVRKLPALVARLGANLAKRLRVSSDDELESERRRTVMGQLVVRIIVLLCAYALLLAALERFEIGVTSSTYISLPIIGLFGIGSWTFIRSSGYPMSTFGLGWSNLAMSFVESVVLTPVFCVVIVGLKWGMMQLQPAWRGYPLFERPDWMVRLVEPPVVKLLVIYFVSCVVQELIVRCALQSSLESFLMGKGTRLKTILVCALMFAVNHLHMKFEFALAVFVPGIFWGWLFARRRHLIGPVLSHFAVGAFVFFVLGMSLP